MLNVKTRRGLRDAIIIEIFALVLTAAVCVSPAFAGAKRVFLFIGDGMGAAQRNAAEIYLAGMRAASGDDAPRESQLVMNSLPISGQIGTDSKSGITDSAAAGTALATGQKTKNGAVASDGGGKNYRSIATIAKEMGMKVGIVTSTFLQDATPAAFYAHADSRKRRYEIGLQLAESGFEYFAGGGFISPKGGDKKQRDLAEIAVSKGYRVTATRAGFESLTPGGRAIAVSPRLRSGYMPFAIDARDDDISLAEFVKKGIELLDGDDGFFMMVEGGQIDIACHANDAASAIHETLALDEAISAALGFLRAHPDDTLIVVTSDHETGGMSLAVTPDGRDSFYGAMSRQRGSYSVFERTVGSGGSDDISKARNFFGDGVSATDTVQRALRLSKTAKKNRPAGSAEYKKLYGPYDPFTIACMREMNARAGVTWSTFYHTGKRVPVSAAGAGSEAFAGEYENTEIFTKLLEAMRRER